VRDAALAAYAHADVPFADVVAALGAPRADASNPLFQVMFNYLRPSGAAERNWAGLALDAFNDVRHRVVFELELDIVEHPDGRVSGAFSYADERIDSQFAEALAASYLQFVDAPHDALGAAQPRFSIATTHAPEPLPLHRASAEAEALAQAWRDFFEGQTLSLHDDLFEAGATSFDVVRFVDAAQKAGLAITIGDVFAAPNFAGLANRLADRSLLADGTRGVPAINQ
jgi:non-ribosomal peptide synthetase component F